MSHGEESFRQWGNDIYAVIQANVQHGVVGGGGRRKVLVSGCTNIGGGSIPNLNWKECSSIQNVVAVQCQAVGGMNASLGVPR